MKCLTMYRGRGGAKRNTVRPSLGWLGSVTSGAGGHGRWGRTQERPVKGFVGVIGVLKCVFILRVTAIGGIRLIRLFSLLSPTRCRRIFQTDALGSTTAALLLGGGCQLGFSHFRVRGLLGNLPASLTARGRWAWEGGWPSWWPRGGGDL